MKLTLKIWRQAERQAEGAMHTYELDDVSEDMSFLEMLDVLNEKLNHEGEEPIAFDSDCREGICGMCGLMINGEAHGPEVTTTCQLHMRSFTDGETITIEPWRADPFPVLKDLCVDRSAFDRIIQPGGYISVNTGAAPDAHATPVPKDNADRAFDVATCIGCGACVAACPNGSASLFLGAKITHLGELPQGQAERDSRVVDMVAPARPRGLRRLHEHRRVHRGLPQGDPARRDLPAEPGSPARHSQGLLVHICPCFDKTARNGHLVHMLLSYGAHNLRTGAGRHGRHAAGPVLVLAGAAAAPLSGSTAAPLPPPVTPVACAASRSWPARPTPAPRSGGTTARWSGSISVNRRSAVDGAYRRSYASGLRMPHRLHGQRRAAADRAAPPPPRAPPPCVRSTSSAR